MKTLVIKHEDHDSAFEPCALCGQEEHVGRGPAIYLEGTRNIVCLDCARQHDPNVEEVYAAIDPEIFERVLDANRRELTRDEVRATGRVQSWELAQQHDAIVLYPGHAKYAEELAESRHLEQQLVRRGRIDVLFRQGVHGLAVGDPEYSANEVVRAAAHTWALRLETQELPSGALHSFGDGLALPCERTVPLDVIFPTACVVCFQDIGAEPPLYLVKWTAEGDSFMCARCVSLYAPRITELVQDPTRKTA